MTKTTNDEVQHYYDLAANNAHDGLNSAMEQLDELGWTPASIVSRVLYNLGIQPDQGLLDAIAAFRAEHDSDPEDDEEPICPDCEAAFEAARRIAGDC